MRSLTFFALALIAFASSALAQAPDTAWTRQFRPEFYFDAMAVTPSNEIVMVEAHAMYATWWKWNEFGSLVDSNLTIGFELDDSGHVDTSVIGTWDVEPCIDGTGDCIIVGTSRDISQPDGRYFPFAARINNSGDVVWCRSYDCFTAPGLYLAHSVVTAPDGGAILYGQRDVDFAVGINAWGEPLWCRSYPVSGHSIIAVPGGALLFGYGDPDTNAVRINAHGEILWASQVEFGDAVLLGGDTVICGTNWGGSLKVFKMDAVGDTFGLRAYPSHICYQLIAEPYGGWSMLASNNWFGRFDDDGNVLWSTVLPFTFTRAVRMRHADYALWSGGTFGKTTSGPRNAPEQLTVMPLNGGLEFSWPDAEWRFYQLRSSLSSDGPFSTWEGTTGTHVFWRSLDPMAPQKFFVVVGTDDPSH